MNAVTAFLLIGSIYLVIIAYGVVRTRKRGLPPRVRLIAAAIQVVVPPAVLIGALLLTGDQRMVATWGTLLAMLMVAGVFLAMCTEIVARRTL
ncbi:hypothetical protein GG804_19700 [Sphingomonas histidinilytica]|jgi:hypothetical protein|uniref:hypothetical protein n=1 Tax=Rhizorhabdus histidinilytica TaxID=439228 RepID=UPI000F78F5A9|nr:hypothetical protein [Rhizorhabdus histidinilytica]MBO9378997.1 hypothetical protein [Rhizorhabdus histidinilytica]QEH80278.1 hypothetical protein EIK56_19995 [Sphingomonas sp. C8-2]